MNVKKPGVKRGPKTFPASSGMDHPKTAKPNLHRAFREAKKARKIDLGPSNLWFKYQLITKDLAKIERELVLLNDAVVIYSFGSKLTRTDQTHIASLNDEKSKLSTQLANILSQVESDTQLRDHFLKMKLTKQYPK